MLQTKLRAGPCVDTTFRIHNIRNLPLNSVKIRIVFYVNLALNSVKIPIGDEIKHSFSSVYFINSCLFFRAR